MKKDLYNLVYSNNTNISGIEEIDVNLTLNTNTNIVIGGIEGYVYDSNGKPVIGATVKIFDQTFTPFAHSITDAQGKYQILNIPTGNYKINCVQIGYLYNSSIQIFIPSVDIVNQDFTLILDDTYGQNVIAGLLLVEGTREPINNAEIIVKDSVGDVVVVTYSADDGEFLITDLIDGTYTIEPILIGYKTTTVNKFTVSSGLINNVIITMLKVQVDAKGTYTGQIVDNVGVPVFGAIVGLYKIIDGKEFLVKYTRTNAEGRYMFGNVEEGEYKVKAKNIGSIPKQNTNSDGDN